MADEEKTESDLLPRCTTMCDPGPTHNSMQCEREEHHDAAGNSHHHGGPPHDWW